MEVVYKYCIANGYVQNDICALCNDGIMLEKQLYEPELLKKLNQVVKDETGFDLNFVEKPLDEDYLDILDENLHFNLYDGDELEGVCADYFKMLYHDKFIVKNNHLYFYNGVYWEKDEHGKATRLSSFVDNEFKQQIVKNSFRVRADLLSYSLRFEEWIKLEYKYDSEFVKILVQKINERHQMSINITDIKNTIVAKLQKEDKNTVVAVGVSVYYDFVNDREMDRFDHSLKARRAARNYHITKFLKSDNVHVNAMTSWEKFRWGYARFCTPGGLLPKFLESWGGIHYGHLVKFASGFFLPVLYALIIISLGSQLATSEVHEGYNLGIFLCTVGSLTVVTCCFSLYCELVSRASNINPKVNPSKEEMEEIQDDIRKSVSFHDGSVEGEMIVVDE